MRETVKIVNGHEITRLKGCKGHYQVIIKKFSNDCYKAATFKTIKAAAAFCETL